MTRVSSTIDHRNDFSGPDPVDAQGPTYTEFRAEGRDSLGRLEGDSARPRIGAALALHLLTFPLIEVRYGGVKIDPAASIERGRAFSRFANELGNRSGVTEILRRDDVCRVSDTEEY